MTLPTTVNLGRVFSTITRDRSYVLATLSSELELHSDIPNHLEPGSYNGGFHSVTGIDSSRIPDRVIATALAGRISREFPEVSDLTPDSFRELYTFNRHYFTTTG
jgi:hypothetical protein